MDNDYVINNEVARGKIAMDIKYRKLNKASIERLCRNPTIKSAFWGTEYLDKRSKREWNKDYLDMLSYSVIAESFNRDYLLYLDEVADFVSRKATYRKITIAGIVIILVIISGVIVYKYILNGVRNESQYKNTTAPRAIEQSWKDSIYS